MSGEDEVWFGNVGRLSAPNGHPPPRQGERTRLRAR
jgi:hypothetical protein